MYLCIDYNNVNSGMVVGVCWWGEFSIDINAALYTNNMIDMYGHFGR